MSEVSKVWYQNKQCFTFDKFCFLQVNQQKRVGMVSTNITYSEQIYKLFKVKTIPDCVFNQDNKVGRFPVLFYQTEKSIHRSISIKTPFLKFLQYSLKYTWVKFLRTTIFKNICVRLLLNWLYEVIVWNFVSGSQLIPFWLSNITKISVAFKSKL